MRVDSLQQYSALLVYSLMPLYVPSSVILKPMLFYYSYCVALMPLYCHIGSYTVLESTKLLLYLCMYTTRETTVLLRAGILRVLVVLPLCVIQCSGNVVWPVSFNGGIVGYRITTTLAVPHIKAFAVRHSKVMLQ